jgi:hypothetical protein
MRHVASAPLDATTAVAEGARSHTEVYIHLFVYATYRAEIGVEMAQVTGEPLRSIRFNASIRHVS